MVAMVIVSTLRRCETGYAIHPRVQHFGYVHGAIGLLVIFQYSHEGTSDSQTGAVQGMDENIFALFGFVTGLHTPALKIGTVRAGGYFAVGVL